MLQELQEQEKELTEIGIWLQVPMWETELQKSLLFFVFFLFVCLLSLFEKKVDWDSISGNKKWQKRKKEKNSICQI